MKAARQRLARDGRARSGRLCRSEPGSLAPRPRPLGERTLDVDAFVAEHNRNADRIQSLEAKPTISGPQAR